MERLHDLLLALFDDVAELQRFLVIEKLPQPALPSSAYTLSGYVLEVVRELFARDRVDEKLFNALIDRSPGRTDDILAVASDYFTRKTAGPVPEPDEPVDGHEGFAAELRAALRATPPPDDLARATDPDHFPWTGAAAVLGRFWPTSLEPLHPVDGSALTAMTGLVHVEVDGMWVLRDPIRTACLDALMARNLVDLAISVNSMLPDRKRDYFRDLFEGYWPRNLIELGEQELDDYRAVITWLEPHGGYPPELRTAVLAALERRELLNPLRSLVGTHFRGRKAELEELTRHVHGATAAPTIVVQGTGGAGKSTLLGRVLLELEAGAVLRPISFAYLDFDRVRNDPREPRALLAQIARQLRLLHATTEQAQEFAAHESWYRSTDLRRASDILDIDLGTGLDQMIEVLAQRLTVVRDAYGPPGAPSLVLVLDTFEEVQARGPGAVADLMALGSALRHHLPDLKVVIAGRGVTAAETPELTDVPVIELGDLSSSVANEVLEELGVVDAHLRDAVVNRFGGNPLTLRLAAETLTRSDLPLSALMHATVQADALSTIAVEQVQGMLYSRILGHIRDPEVVKVAHPGLAVRRVTVDVIREVLAQPCGLDPQRAETIFDKLRVEVSLFDREDENTLRHRQDVRRIMLRTMLDEPGRAATVAAIHQRAIQYYRDEKGLDARAEALYHLLMSGADPRGFDRLWEPALRSALEPALSEPLPARARKWLEVRLGRAGHATRPDWTQEDWEAEAVDRAQSWLASGRPDRALDVLLERPQWLPGSRLYPIAVAARLAAGDVGGAVGELEHGIASAAESGDLVTQAQLAEQAVEVWAVQRNAHGVADAARLAAVTCDLLGEQERGVDVLTNAVHALLDIGPMHADAVGGELAARFVHLPAQTLRDQPDLVRRVLKTAGPIQPDVLHHAAAEVGDQTEGRNAVFKSDPIAVARLLTDVPRSALTDLAEEMGLPKGKWDKTDLASYAVRSGRTGKAVTLGLDFARDAAVARNLVVDQLVRPADQWREEAR